MELQAELDEQTEYQAMVSKLAATVNRRKPGGLVGQALAAPIISKPPTLHPTALDRKVPAEEEEEETLSQVFY